MSKFLKLTDSIINIKYIHSIVKMTKKYRIYVMSTSFEGLKWNMIEVRDDSSDYKIISDWIANQ